VRKARDFTHAQEQLYDATRGLPDADSLGREITSLFPSGDIFAAYPSLLEMDALYPPVSWLWPSWIPRGMLTLLGAAPGTGKSFVALDLARRVIEGLPFPDGAAPGRRGRVLIVDAEGVPSLLQDRARAWGFDRHRLFLMLPKGPEHGIDLSNPAGREELRARCFNIQPELVIIDSLAAATSRGESSLEGARDDLQFLGSLANQYETGLLVIHHLRKRTGSGQVSALQPGAEDIRGSSHLSAAARSLLTLGLTAGPNGQPDLNGPRRLMVSKTNLCRCPPALGLAIEEGEASVPVLRWLPEAVGSEPPSYSRQCAAWLLDFLEQARQPVKPRDVVEAAQAAEFPRRTIYRARRALGGRVADVGNSRYDPGKRWAAANSR